MLGAYGDFQSLPFHGGLLPVRVEAIGGGNKTPSAKMMGKKVTVPSGFCQI